MSTDTPADETPEAAAAPAEDMKQKFRDALAKKNAKSGRPGEAHLDGKGGAKGSQGSASTQRDFRRKSG